MGNSGSPCSGMWWAQYPGSYRGRRGERKIPCIRILVFCKHSSYSLLKWVSGHGLPGFTFPLPDSQVKRSPWVCLPGCPLSPAAALDALLQALQSHPLPRLTLSNHSSRLPIKHQEDSSGETPPPPTGPSPAIAVITKHILLTKT